MIKSYLHFKKIMIMKNRYIKFSKISEHQFRQIVKFFSDDLTAIQIKETTGVNRNTVNRYLRSIRERIAEFCENESTFSDKANNEYISGAKQIKEEKSSKPYGGTIVIGIFKRDGKVYTEIVPDYSKAMMYTIMRGKINLDSIRHSNNWRGYNGLVDLGRKKHFRLDSDANDFFQSNPYTKNTEYFWEFASSRLVKFKGMQQSTFYLHLKECEFRFNYSGHDIDKLIMKMFEF